MRRLFWKFFFIIWFTMTGSVIGVIALTTILETPPFIQEIVSRQRLQSLAVAERLLREEGAAAAEAFARASRSAPQPIALSVKNVAVSCTGEANERFRAVRVRGVCYHLEIDAPEVGLLERRWPQLVPWLLAMIASAISGFWLARYLIRPVAHLRQGLSALAHGRFDVRIGDKMGGRKDEVTDLAHDFDVSASRLQDLQGSQQRLFHDVSHELRSPLSRLQAALGVLRQSPAKLDTMIGRMDREIDRIDGLIGEILTLSRLVSGSERPLEAQALDIIDLLRDILGDAAFEGEARGIEIRSQLPGGFVAEVNGELIYRALENVVRNALKYAPENSAVAVGCQVTGDRLDITVADEGPGVPAGDLETIFQPFLRSGDAETHGGFGLGLAIARHAIERHGGRVSASTAANGGLVITLSIPRSGLADSAAAT